MSLLTRILLCLISLSSLYYVLNYIEPPRSWPQATTNQIIVFYLPLLASITLLLNVFINHILRSFVAGLGIIFLITLLGAKQLTPLSAALTFFVTGMIFVHSPSIRFIHYRKIRKIAHLQKDKHSLTLRDKHSETKEKQQKILKRL